jgi:hypothetical protein
MKTYDWTMVFFLLALVYAASMGAEGWYLLITFLMLVGAGWHELTDDN